MPPGGRLAHTQLRRGFDSLPRYFMNDLKCKGKLGVVFSGEFSFLVCGDCGIHGKIMVAAKKGQNEKAYILLVCADCQKYLAAIERPEKLLQIIGAAKSRRNLSDSQS